MLDSCKIVADSIPNLNKKAEHIKIEKNDVDDVADDPNKAAMEQLKVKFKNFIENQTKVFKRMQDEIDFLKKENTQLKQNNK